ncbi:EMC6-like membrane protein [Archaeoglobus veneficus]|uniref:EMC6-like membrane protein n=1 Tax=Archaeoglobus veneficus TaxID=58290 RepID=UPI00373AE6F3
MIGLTDTIKTLMPLALGGIAGVLSYIVTSGGGNRDPVGIIILVFLIYLHKFLLPKFGINPEGKDWLAISFLSLAAWYVVWTFLLNL